MVSAELLLQSPRALLARSPPEVADTPQQLPEDRRLPLAQSGLEVLQHLLRGGLAVHAGLERHKVAQVGQQLVVLGRGWRRRRTSALLFLVVVAAWLAGGHPEVITVSHLCQQGRGGGRGRVRLALRRLPAEMSFRTGLLRQRLLNNGSVLERDGK